MAKIFKAPKEIELPEYMLTNNGYDWEQKDNEYKKKLKAHIKAIGYNEKESGECIKIQTADGYAEYMVLGLKGGAKLIHLELGDAYHNELANHLTPKKIKDKITFEKIINKF
jgi:hypothetical protein